MSLVALFDSDPVSSRFSATQFPSPIPRSRASLFRFLSVRRRWRRLRLTRARPSSRSSAVSKGHDVWRALGHGGADEDDAETRSRSYVADSVRPSIDGALDPFSNSGYATLQRARARARARAARTDEHSVVDTGSRKPRRFRTERNGKTKRMRPVERRGAETTTTTTRPKQTDRTHDTIQIHERKERQMDEIETQSSKSDAKREMIETEKRTAGAKYERRRRNTRHDTKPTTDERVREQPGRSTNSARIRSRTEH